MSSVSSLAWSWRIDLSWWHFHVCRDLYAVLKSYGASSRLSWLRYRTSVHLYISQYLLKPHIGCNSLPCSCLHFCLKSGSELLLNANTLQWSLTWDSPLMCTLKCIWSNFFLLSSKRGAIKKSEIASFNPLNVLLRIFFWHEKLEFAAPKRPHLALSQIDLVTQLWHHKKRKDFVPRKSSALCSAHVDESFFVKGIPLFDDSGKKTMHKRYLIHGSIPSKDTVVPYTSPLTSWKGRRVRLWTKFLT